MVLPMTLRTPPAFTAAESRAQLLLGVLSGLALCMLAYSLAHSVGLRDGLFLQYALMLAGNLVFMLAYFGIGPQYLWPDSPRLSQQVAPLAVLLAMAGAATFLDSTLAVHTVSRAVAAGLRAAAGVAVATVAGALVGVVDYGSAQSMATLLGLATFALALPVAYLRARRGDRVAAYILFG